MKAWIRRARSSGPGCTPWATLSTWSPALQLRRWLGSRPRGSASDAGLTFTTISAESVRAGERVWRRTRVGAARRGVFHSASLRLGPSEVAAMRTSGVVSHRPATGRLRVGRLAREALHGHDQEDPFHMHIIVPGLEIAPAPGRIFTPGARPSAPGLCRARSARRGRLRSRTHARPEGAPKARAGGACHRDRR